MHKDSSIATRSCANVQMKLDPISQLNLALAFLLHKDTLHIRFTTQQNCQVVMKEPNQTPARYNFSVGIVDCRSVKA